MRHGNPYPTGGDESHRANNVLWACRQLLVWGGLALIVYLAVGYPTLLLPSEPGRPVPQTPPASASAAGSAIVNPQTFRANRQGHIVLEAAVNGTPVKFLLDTGATMVVLTVSDAAAAGIGRSSLSFTGRANTANGVIRTAPVTLREVRLGPFSAENVSAAVIENLETSLLGVSFLKRLQSYEMRDGVLTITW